MASPNFVYLGYDKSGSTWLFKNLLAHPEVSVPSSKETFYFDRNYAKGIEWYSSFFDGNKKSRIDISHDYIFDNEVLLRIKTDFPKIKCMIIVRNPIHKTWSLYKFAKRNAQVDGGLLDAIESSPGILERSFYYDSVKFAKDLFGESLSVFLFDDLEKDPVVFFQSIAKFLEIDPNAVIPVITKINPASKPRFAALGCFFKPTVSILRRVGAHRLIGILKSNAFMHKILFKDNRDELSAKEFDVLSNYFSEDVDKLSMLLGSDLSAWLKRDS